MASKKDKKTKPKKYANATPVEKKDAKVGDIRGVTHGGGGATFWTSSQLGIKKPSGGGAVNPTLRDLSISLAKGGTIPKGVTGYAPDNSGPGYDVGGSTVTKGGASKSKAPGGYITAEEARKGATGMIMTGSNLKLLEAARGVEAGTYYTAPTTAESPTTTSPSGGTKTVYYGGSSGPADQFKSPDFNVAESPLAQVLGISVEWGDFMNPSATQSQFQFPGTHANSTPMYPKGLISPAQGGGAVGGGAGGGGGGSWGPVSSGTPASTPGTGAPAANKPQAQAAGIPDTGGQSAGNRQLTPSELKTAFDLIAKIGAGFQGLLDNITASADDVDGAMNNMDTALTNEYNRALADLPDYNKMKSDYEELYKTKMSIIEDRQEQLERRYKEDKASIKEDYATQKDEMKETQKGETGRLAGGLASAGAYLGFDNVNHSAMLSLEVTHQRELTVLGQAKMAALSDARRAFEDADFKLLGEQINAIESYNDQIFKITTTHFDQTLKLAQEARDNVRFAQDTEKFYRQKQAENIDVIIQSEKPPTPQDIQAYAKAMGIDVATAEKYVQAKQNNIAFEKQMKLNDEKRANDANARGWNQDARELQRLLNDMNKGTFFEYGGKTYEGTKSASSADDKPATIDNLSKNYNNNPLAAMMIAEGWTNPQMLQAFVSQKPPEFYVEMMRASEPDMSDKRIEEAWNATRHDALDPGMSRQLVDLSPANQSRVLMMAQRERAEAQARGEDLDLPAQVTYQELSNPGRYSQAELARMIEEATKTQTNDFLSQYVNSGN